MSKLKEMRTSKRIRLNEIASFIGVTPSAVHHWESGDCRPNFENLRKLAEFYRCTIDELVGEADDERRI